jgi:hypothetical protein
MYEVKFSWGIVTYAGTVIYIVKHEPNNVMDRHYWRRFELCKLLDIDTQKLNRIMKKCNATIFGKGSNTYFLFKNKEDLPKAKETMEALITSKILR